MEPHGVERKLTAILSADVKGYSRLMGEDEVATLRTLTAYREVIDSLIHQHRGRIVGTAGDGLLAEFASAVDAVQCAVEIQQALKEKNVELPEHRRMEFRIGINVGDVIVEGAQIYGDGVNIAARLEALAEPGGICISGTVYDQVKNKLVLKYEDLGEQMVKNIAEPVRVLKVVLEVPSPLVGEGQGEGASGRAEAVTTPPPNPSDYAQDRLPPQGGKEPQRPAQGLQEKRRLGTAHLRWVVAGLVLIVGAVVTLRYSSLLTLITYHSSLVTQEEPGQALPLPDKPSIAVLPFVNISEDPEQEYFSDGLTEDLITDLSKFSNLFVIARNSTFAYKGKAAKVEDIGRELGVRYVLEGSVRKADNRVRITAQLVEATTGHHVWAERYDRPLTDIFALQDEITQQIAANLQVEVLQAELERVRHIPTENLNAYDSLVRGREYRLRFTKEANTQARQMFERAIELDSTCAEAYAQLGWTYLADWTLQWSQDPQSLERASELAQKAVTLDNSLPRAHILLGYVSLWKNRQYDLAIAEGERALALDPNNADGYATLANILTFAGRPEEAIALLEKGMRLNPRAPNYFFYLFELGHAYHWLRQYEKAIATQKRVLLLNPNLFVAHLELAKIYDELGREEEARSEVAEVVKLNPQYSLESVKERHPYKDPAVLERYLAALRKAGLK